MTSIEIIRRFVEDRWLDYDDREVRTVISAYVRALKHELKRRTSRKIVARRPRMRQERVKSIYRVGMRKTRHRVPARRERGPRVAVGAGADDD